MFPPGAFFYFLFHHRHGLGCFGFFLWPLLPLYFLFRWLFR